MTNVLDWILDLFRDPVQAQSFINDPARTMANAGVQNVSAAQVNAVAASVAPAAVIQGGGDPVQGLQHAVAQTHGIAFAPQRQTEVLSNNDTLSHNDTRFLSPETNVVNHAGEDQQQGVGNVDLDFGDITFGDKTTNTATDGSVINTGTAGDIDATNVDGDGNVVGDNNDNVNTGDIDTGNNSPVVIGEDNDVDVDDRGDINAGGDVIKDNEGPVINDVDMSGGNGGNANAGGGLLGGGQANAGGGGGGGGITINDNDTTTTTNNVDGNQTTVGNIGGDMNGSVSGGTNTEDNSTHDSHDDNSVDNSVEQNVNTNVDTGIDIGLPF